MIRAPSPVISVGGISLRLIAAPGMRLFLGGVPRPFFGERSEDERLALRIRPGPLRAPRAARIRFRSDLWSAVEHPEGVDLLLAYNRRTARRLRLPKGGGPLEMGFEGRPLVPGRLVSMLRQPGLEPLFTHLLADRRGFLLHAAAAEAGGRAWVFAGASGAGKSTLSLLWRGIFPDAAILSDERVILRRGPEGWLAYGTPWRGTAGFSSPGPLPLGGVLLIRKAARPSLRPLAPAEAAAGLLPCLLLPFGFRAVSGRILETLDRLVREVPAAAFAYPKTSASPRWLAQRLARIHSPSRRIPRSPARAASRSASPRAKAWK